MALESEDSKYPVTDPSETARHPTNKQTQPFKAYPRAKTDHNKHTIKAKLYTLGKKAIDSNASVKVQDGEASDTSPNEVTKEATAAEESESGDTSNTVKQNDYIRGYPVGHAPVGVDTITLKIQRKKIGDSE
ncbi:hypothetical protein J1614_008888 [Plenodomus biglobosus]|nr:hypothetical protein J1614_008888 [Plenodomus biglobosus]